MLNSPAAAAIIGGGLRRRSTLNNDGFPLQTCITSSARGIASRVILDAADPLAAIERAIELTASEWMRPLIERTPLSDEVWIAVPSDGDGMAIYVDATGRDARQWLSAILPDATTALAALETMQPHIVPASFALEGPRAKLYFRLARPGGIENLGHELFVRDEMIAFLREAIGPHSLDLNGLVGAIGFSISDGSVADVKLDVCGHCVPIDRALIDHCTSMFDLPRMPDFPADDQLVFIGLGITASGELRLNVYARPAVIDVEWAIERAAGYLREMQHEDGHWSDYELPVGASDQWVTAFAGSAMAPVDREAAERAADWLLTRRTYAAGWGFNGITGPDADSTAFAIDLLDALHREVPSRDREFLLRHWRDGGFATYDTDDAWGMPHADVTPLAFRSAGDESLRPHLELGERAYWWESPHYASYMAASILGVTSEPSQAPAPGDFDLACAAGVECHRRSDAREPLLRTLLAHQRGDGSWPGSPSLRVPEQTCRDPWNDPSVPRYTDHAGVITTAMALRVLVGCRTYSTRSSTFQ